MNFYEEVAAALESIGEGATIREVPPELRPSPEDFARLDARITARVAENEQMLARSQYYAEHHSLPVL